MSAATGSSRRWYREPWPWLLMLPPLASVVGGVTMVYLAVGASNALVVDDYARIEEVTREQWAAEQRAEGLALRARVTLSRGVEGFTDVVVELHGGAALEPPPALELRLRHVAHQAADRRLTLERGPASYAGRTRLAAGRYELHLAPADGAWLLVGAVPPTDGAVELGAGPAAGRE